MNKVLSTGILKTAHRYFLAAASVGLSALAITLSTTQPTSVKPSKDELTTQVRIALQAKNPKLLEEKYGKLAPVSWSSIRRYLVQEKEHEEDEVERGDVGFLEPPTLPLFPFPQKSGQCLQYVTQTIHGTSNEPSIALDFQNPAYVLTSTNDYSQKEHRLRGTLQASSDHGQSFLYINIEETASKDFPFNGDMIVRKGPKGTFYVAEMAFQRVEKKITNNGLKILPILFGQDQNVKIDPKTIQTVVSHLGEDSPFEDKPNLAVNLENGLMALTNTQYNGAQSQINLYFIKPDGTVQRTVEAISGDSTNVQFSVPAFGKGGKFYVAYRDYSTDTIDMVYFRTPESEPYGPYTLARIGSPIGDYFKGFDKKFRASSAPDLAIHQTEGSRYVVYDDATSGKSLTYLIRYDGAKEEWLDTELIPRDLKQDHWMSSVAVDQKSGVVAVTYRTLDDDHDTYERKGILSFDRGKTWSQPITLSKHPSKRTLDGWNGEFSGDYEEVAIGTSKLDEKTTTIYIHASHQETRWGKDNIPPSVHDGVAVLTVPTAQIEAAINGNAEANQALHKLVAEVLQKQS